MSQLPFWSAADTTKVNTASYGIDVNFTMQYTSDELRKSKTEEYFSGSTDLQQTLIIADIYWRKQIVLSTDLSVRYYIDSTIIKEHDLWVLDFDFSSSGDSKVKSSVNLKYSTPMFNKYKEESNRRKFVEGIGNPSQFEFGYGIQFPVFSFSTFTFNLSNIKLRTFPRDEGVLRSDQNVMRFQSLSLHASIGFKSRLSLRKVILGKVKWKHQSEFFLDRFDQSHVNVEIENNVGINIYKDLQLKLITEILYDPLFSRKSQWRNRVMIGFDIGN